MAGVKIVKGCLLIGCLGILVVAGFMAVVMWTGGPDILEDPDAAAQRYPAARVVPNGRMVWFIDEETI